MTGPRLRITCGRCGKRLSARLGGDAPVAHKCPHGRTCIAPAWERSKPSCDQCEHVMARDARHEGGAS